MSATRPTTRKRRLILHAGTHKTASSDIQCRLRRSAALLEQQQIIYRFPETERWHFKQLVKAMSKDSWSPWQSYLQRWSKTDADVLISAEQFAPQLTRPEAIRSLQRITAEHGFELTIIIFIRSQLDYINSRYGYSLKRFYHSKTFAEYVEDVLRGDRVIRVNQEPEGKKKRSDIFDFWNYFAALLQEQSHGLDVRFIPFRQTHADPFIQLLQTLKLDPSLPWAQRKESSLNQRTGPRGTWLARELSRRLKHHRISPETISGSTAIIPREVEFRGWKDGSFWGFDAALAHRVQNHFKASNDLFAQAVWGHRWSNIFVHDGALLDRAENSFVPSGPEESVRMHRIADHLLLRIHRRQTQRPLHGLRELVERQLSRLI